MDYRKKIDLNEVEEFIRNSSETSKIYVGGDSERHKFKGVWHADYTVVVVVHKDGNKGCRVFGEVTRMIDYDQKKNKPHLRLMNEVYKVAELYLKIYEFVEDRTLEVHLDISRKKTEGSNIVMDEAIGYIRGTCNVIPLLKPDSPAASFCADRYSQLRQMRSSAMTDAKTASATVYKRRRKKA